MTFIHYIEHMIRESLSFPLYSKKKYELRVVDYEGREIMVQAYAFSRQAVKKRQPMLLEQEVIRKKCFFWDKIGNTSIGVINVYDALESARQMVLEGRFFHEI